VGGAGGLYYKMWGRPKKKRKIMKGWSSRKLKMNEKGEAQT